MKKLLLVLSLCGVVGLEAKTVRDAMKTGGGIRTQRKSYQEGQFGSGIQAYTATGSTLDLSNQGITSLEGLSDSQCGGNWVVAVDLSGNKLTSIKASDFAVFKGNSNFTNLDLSNNFISYIEQNMFNDYGFAAYMENLNLSGNCLSSMYNENYIGSQNINFTNLSNQRTTGCPPKKAQPKSSTTTKTISITNSMNSDFKGDIEWWVSSEGAFPPTTVNIKKNQTIKVPAPTNKFIIMKTPGFHSIKRGWITGYSPVTIQNSDF